MAGPIRNIYSGSWFLANQEIYAALQYAGYDSTFVIGTEGHNGKHGGAILPDALRWVWRDYPKPIAKSAKVNGRGLYAILDPDKDWEFSAAITNSPRIPRSTATATSTSPAIATTASSKVDAASGKINIWKDPSGGAHGLAYGPDGRPTQVNTTTSESWRTRWTGRRQSSRRDANPSPHG